jgi:hypothetical protein
MDGWMCQSSGATSRKIRGITRNVSALYCAPLRHRSDWLKLRLGEMSVMLLACFLAGWPARFAPLHPWLLVPSATFKHLEKARKGRKKSKIKGLRKTKNRRAGARQHPRMSAPSNVTFSHSRPFKSFGKTSKK